MAETTKQLFPTFDVPTFSETDTEESERYKPSVSFDFEKGDFERDGANRMTVADGKEAFEQWCLKTAMTERDTCLAYNSDIGTELENLNDQPDTESMQAQIEETITEALMVNPATEYVRDFEFSGEGDEIYVEFTVKGYEWTETKIKIPITTG